MINKKMFLKMLVLSNVFCSLFFDHFRVDNSMVIIIILGCQTKDTLLTSLGHRSS